MPRKTIEEQFASMIKRVAQRQASAILEGNRRHAEAKEKQERAAFKKKLELGGALLSGRFAEFAVPTLIGMLLDGRDRVAQTPALKLEYHERGEAFLTKIASLQPVNSLTKRGPRAEPRARRDSDPSEANASAPPRMRVGRLDDGAKSK